MAGNLQQITHSMFRSKFEREKNNKFEPYFLRFIGVENVNTYDNILRTLKEKCEEHKDKCIIFDNVLPLSGEMELMQYVYNELNTMNIRDMVNQDINIFQDQETNHKFLMAMDYIIPLAIEKENFFNENVRNNFITKVIVWAYTWIKEIEMNDNINPKCIYYGNIQRHDIYFLILLYLMNFDIIYVNPLKEEFWNEIEGGTLSTCEKYMGILNVESFDERAKKGTVIDNVETVTKQIERDIQEDLFTGTGMYKPWQFRRGYTKSVLLDTILEDIYIYWNEPSRVRDGFKVVDKTVYVPAFFKKIDGQYADVYEYQKLVKFCVESPNTLFFNTGNISMDAKVTDDMYQLMFCQLSDGTFDVEEIKKLPMYRFGKYSEEVQNLILKKFNEVILDKNTFLKPFDKELSLKLLVLIITLNENIVRLIDNFDYTANIPKIVIYLDKEEGIPESMQILLGYLHKIGIDIVIFNPSGLLNINNVISDEAVNIIRLERMDYESNFKKLINLKQSVFARMLKK